MPTVVTVARAATSATLNATLPRCNVGVVAAPSHALRRTSSVVRNSIMGRCNPGLRATRSLVVEQRHTALSLGSGDVAVVGTPALLALAEGACVDAVCHDLEEGETTVGAWAEIEHLKASGVGTTLEATATLMGHHNRRLEFSVSVECEGHQIAKVRHRRVLVDRQRFVAGAL